MKYKDRNEVGESVILYLKDRGFSDKEVSQAISNAYAKIRIKLNPDKSRAKVELKPEETEE